MRKQSGFTLMELMVVIAIIGIVTMAVVPNLISWRNNALLSEAARQIYSDLQLSRKEAIKRNTLITVDFSTGADSYQVLADGTPIATKRMPPGVGIDSAVFNTLGNIASFNSLGFGRTVLDEDNNGAVIVSLSSGRSSTIAVTSGGSIRIQ